MIPTKSDVCDEIHSPWRGAGACAGKPEAMLDDQERLVVIAPLYLRTRRGHMV